MLAADVLQYADLQACCACLGFREGNRYKIDSDAEASIRAILRYLRNESAQCDIRRELGRLRIVSSDLIPLLCSYSDKKTVVELVIRLLMNLTQPAIVCFRQEIPKDRELYGAYVQVDDLLRSYKKDFADEELFRVLCSTVGSYFDLKWEDRTEDDRLLVERVLILVRNVLHITPETLESTRTDEDVSVHDQLLWAMHLTGWDDLLLFLGNANDAQMFTFHTLEIISLMLREQTPDIIATAGRGNGENGVTLDEMVERNWMLERAEKRRFLYHCNSRQNRFGGTFELSGTPSLTNRPLIYHHDVMAKRLFTPDGAQEFAESIEQSVGLVNLDVDKRRSRKAKNRKPLVERTVHRRSVLAVQMHLQKFCWKFLQFCYNPIMRTVQSSISRQVSQKNDETYFLWAMNFFSGFCRLYCFRPQYLSETLNVSTFHVVYAQVMQYRELLLADKKGGGSNYAAVQTSRRLALAVATYREFFTCLRQMLSARRAQAGVTGAGADAVDVEESESVGSREEQMRIQKAAAESIMANIFYTAEYHEVYPLLMKEFNEALQTREYLRDLVEGAHLFIDLLVKHTKNGTCVQRVRRQRTLRRSTVKARTQRSALHQEASTESEESPEVRQARLEYHWSNQLVSPLTSLLLQGNRSLDEGGDAEDEEDDDGETSRLFDPTSSGSETRQLQSAVRRIQALLFAGDVKSALALIRRMWRLWPEVVPVDLPEGGSSEALLSDERVARLPESGRVIVGALREIHFTEFAQDDVDQDEDEEEVDDEQELYDEEAGFIDDQHYEGGTGGGVVMVTDKEVLMDTNGFLLKFAHPRVVHALTLLLADYVNIPRSTIKAVVHMIHRIAVRQRLPGIFFQLRLFLVFQQFLENAHLHASDEFKVISIFQCFCVFYPVLMQRM